MEWCEDASKAGENRRVTRSGGARFDSSAGGYLTTDRRGLDEAQRYYLGGFRCVLGRAQSH